MPDLTTEENRYERIRALTEVSRALTYTTSMEEVWRMTVERAAELMGAEKALLMLTEAVSHEREESTRIIEAQGRARATLGHELRSPLTAIHSYSDLLLEGLLAPLTDRQRESISRIRMSGRHLLAIIENVLDMARLDTGVLRLTNTDVAIAEVLNQAVQMVQPAAMEKDQELRHDCPNDLVVRADPDRLRQALLNLIGNASKYSPEGGVIQVEAATLDRDGEPFATIAVSDNGPGISDDVLASIFEPYNRGGDTQRHTGLGLGLFISRELVRQMGGEIEVRSQPGAGSTFTAFFPLGSGDG